MARQKGDIRKYANEDDKKEGIRKKSSRFYQKNKKKIAFKSLIKRVEKKLLACEFLPSKVLVVARS